MSFPSFDLSQKLEGFYPEGQKMFRCSFSLNEIHLGIPENKWQTFGDFSWAMEVSMVENESDSDKMELKVCVKCRLEEQKMSQAEEKWKINTDHNIRLFHHTNLEKSICTSGSTIFGQNKDKSASESIHVPILIDEFLQNDELTFEVHIGVKSVEGLLKTANFSVPLGFQPKSSETMLEDVLKNRQDVLKNRQHVLVCIQHEVFQKKEVFGAYKSFCNILGNNVMGYPEFDYWFYYFLNGNFDLDHERKTEPKQPELADMPIEVAYKIVKKLNWKEKCIFRNISKKCREVVDTKPLIFDSIFLKDYSFKTFVSFDNHVLEYGVNKSNEIVSIERQKEVTGYGEVEILKNDLKVDKREECEKRVIQTLAIALNNPRLRIRELTFHVKEENLVDKLIALFKCLNHQLHVEFFEYSDDQETYLETEEINFMKILPCLKPGILESIEWSNANSQDWDFDSNLEVLATLDQWKQAKKFATYFKISDNIEKVAHFDDMHVYINGNLKPEHVVYLKNVYLNSPTFNHCILRADGVDEKRIRKELGGIIFPMVNGKTLYVDVYAYHLVFTRK